MAEHLALGAFHPGLSLPYLILNSCRLLPAQSFAKGRGLEAPVTLAPGMSTAASAYEGVLFKRKSTLA